MRRFVLQRIKRAYLRVPSLFGIILHEVAKHRDGKRFFFIARSFCFHLQCIKRSIFFRGDVTSFLLLLFLLFHCEIISRNTRGTRQEYLFYTVVYGVFRCCRGNIIDLTGRKKRATKERICTIPAHIGVKRHFVFQKGSQLPNFNRFQYFFSFKLNFLKFRTTLFSKIFVFLLPFFAKWDKRSSIYKIFFSLNSI